MQTDGNGNGDEQIPFVPNAKVVQQTGLEFYDSHVQVSPAERHGS